MTALVPVQDIERMATAVAKSGLFGIKTAEQGVALMLIAQAEGLHPAIAARDYHVIQGRPALKTDAMMARFQQAGGKVEWKVYTDAEVTGTFSHPAGGSLTVTWTLEQAKRIGLAGKDNWKNYPRAMLRARCISEGIRSVYPGCVVGVYTPEEVQDFDTPAKPEAIKDMGIVEEVEVSVEDASGIPLMTPGNPEPYAYAADKQEWEELYTKMVGKLANHPKLSETEKQEKIVALREANNAYLETWTSTERLAFKAKVVSAGGTAQPPKEQPPVGSELSSTPF